MLCFFHVVTHYIRNALIAKVHCDTGFGCSLYAQGGLLTLVFFLSFDLQQGAFYGTFAQQPMTTGICI